MFVGREQELAALDRAYRSGRFEMVVVYGRRRIGKTTMISRFSRDKRTLFFTAQQQTDANNLSDFCREIATFFSLPSGTRFESWRAAFEYLADRAAKEPFVFVFDEFPYAAAANASLVSALQIVIDHRFQNTRLLMILCGSNQGFMEGEVLGQKSPLHGRRTAQMRIRPFDYRTAREMTPHASDEDAFRYYACVGGVPYYLSNIDDGLSFRENLERLFFSSDGLLFEEPLMLLRQEFRGPAAYNSLLRSLGTGANRQNEIADRSGVERTSVPKYLKALCDLDIVERLVPFGENPATSRRGIYRFADACYDFWYTFVMPSAGDIEAGAGGIVAKAMPEDALDTYFGRRFERVCLQWMLRQSVSNALPISASGFGSWWGTDPRTKRHAEIDVIAADRFSKQMIVGGCKWRCSFNETEALDTLRERSRLVKGFEAVGFYLFSRNPLAAATQARLAGDPQSRSVTLSELYRV